MIPQILAGIGLPVLMEALAGALEATGKAEIKSVASAIRGVQGLINDGELNEQQMRLAHAHLEKMAQIHSEEMRANTAQVNQSLRAEIISEDKYVRRMRPTFGYLMAATWAAQMFALAYVIVFDTPRAVAVLNAMGSLGTIWGVGLSVLGVYVYKRSEDKKQARGEDKKLYWNNVKE